MSSQAHKWRVFPESLFDAGSGSGSDILDSVLETIVESALLSAMTENYKNDYATYDKEYEALKAIQAKGEKIKKGDHQKLLELHERLEADEARYGSCTTEGSAHVRIST
jgi:hypothetical protein